jgi:hypothetical protein
MILPTKYEDLKSNPLNIGAYIVSFLMKEDLTLLQIHTLLIKNKKVDIGYIKLIDTITFLFIAGIIDINNNLIHISNDTKSNFYIPEKLI